MQTVGPWYAQQDQVQEVLKADKMTCWQMKLMTFELTKGYSLIQNVEWQAPLFQTILESSITQEFQHPGLFLSTCWNTVDTPFLHMGCKCLIGHKATSLQPPCWFSAKEAFLWLGCDQGNNNSCWPWISMWIDSHMHFCVLHTQSNWVGSLWSVWGIRTSTRWQMMHFGRQFSLLTFPTETSHQSR